LSDPILSQVLITGALARLRARRPLIHNITNDVVANFTANALLAVGASPVMAPAEEEAEEMVAISQALVINIGTLNTPHLEGMRRAVAAATARDVPWVFDPVACGASAFRRDASAALLAGKPAVIRGNASEILALAGSAIVSKGVDSTHASDFARDIAERLAETLGTVVAVTGQVDYVTDGRRTVGIANGDVMLTRVTGTGCTATALVGAFLGSGMPAFDATVAALATLGVAAELARVDATGPGSFQIALLDALAAIDDETLARRIRLV
jgi:hydroxyethylthiazole kinase